MKFIEFGIGNTWLIRTETERNNGSEIEEKGIVRPIQPQSLYIRVWMGNTVWIIDTKDGFKKTKKGRNKLKIVFGIRSR